MLNMGNSDTYRDVKMRLCALTFVIIILVYQLCSSFPGLNIDVHKDTTYICVFSCFVVLIIFQYSRLHQDVRYVWMRWKLKKDLTLLQNECKIDCFSSNLGTEYSSPSDIGFAPSNDQVSIENPYNPSVHDDQFRPVKEETHDANSSRDSISFKCGSDSGSWLVLNFQRNIQAKKGLIRILWHYKKNLNELGDTYVNVVSTSDENEQLSTDHSENDAFKTNGLTLTVLEPFRRWRIIYNGMMRNVKNSKIHHVRMNLIWSALSSPFDWQSCNPIDPFLESILHNGAIDKYIGSEGDIGMLKDLMRHVCPSGYDQWGAAVGKVLFDSKDFDSVPLQNMTQEENTSDEIDLYYRGVRERHSMEIEFLRKNSILKRCRNSHLDNIPLQSLKIKTRSHVSVIGVSENGFHFVINKVSLSFLCPLVETKPDVGFNENEHQASVPQSTMQHSFGHMMVPGKDIVPITEVKWPNINPLANLNERENSFYYTDAFFVRFKAANRWFNVSIHRLSDEYLYNSANSFPSINEHTNTSTNCRVGFAEMAPNSGRGVAMITFSSSSFDVEENIIDNQSMDNFKDISAVSPKLKKSLKDCAEYAPLVALLGNSASIDENIAGGKGSSLSIMIQVIKNGGFDMDDKCNSLCIPDGVIVTSVAFKRQITSTASLGTKSLSHLIKEVEKKAAEFSVSHGHFVTTNIVDIDSGHPSYLDTQNSKKSDFEEACGKLRKAFLTIDICEEVTWELKKTLDEAFETSNDSCHLNKSSTAKKGSEWNRKRFAIRSSALGEDSDELSAAGQNETFLGVSGTEPDLHAAIRKCWASLFTFQSVEYRRQNGQPVDVDMAVVVQEMVPAKAAGVMFSIHPFTGNPAEVVITANYGLGESIVSAMSEPDTITVLNRFWKKEEHEKYKIYLKNIGSKKSKVVMDSAKNLSGEGTRIESLKNDPDSNRICIQDDIAIELAKISSKLQTVFGNSPRDIEFAIDEHDKIYLLQARPITSLQSWTNHELSHEFDTAIVSHHDINTKGNVGEVFPGATTTLTQSWCARILDLAIQTNRVKTWKRPYNKFSESVVRISHHHVLLNYLDLMLEVVDSRTVTVPMKALDYSVFGHLVTNTDALEKAIERKGGMDGIFTIMKAQIVALKNIFFIRRLMKQPNFDSKFNNPLNIKTNGDSSQIYEEITKASVNVSEMWKLHSAITEASTTLQLITFLVLSESVVNLDFSNELLLDATTILKTNSDNVISGDCPSDLNKLCKAIVKEHKIDDCFSSLSLQDAEAWIMSKQPTANLYSQFLTKFGDRCVREFDLISKPWKEDRKPLISTLQAMLKTENSTKSEEDVNPSKVVKNNISNIDTALDHISRKIKPVTRGILKLILPYTHGSTALREKAKSLGIKQVHEVRLAYRNLAMTMANEGRLPDPELILHMSHFEIHKLILYRSPCIIQKACRRRRLRSSEWENLRFPEIIHGIPVPCSDDQEISDAKDNKGISLKGTPASGGKYKGTGRVVTKLEDAKYIEKGDILITISTDIGWSPYFPLLGGVVTELGGLISHGAVVAREYGLPCIVGVELATSVIRSGEIVLIDGFKGIITQEDNKFSS